MQELIVGFIVLACATYAVWALMPRIWRQSALRAALAWRGTAAVGPLRRLLEKQLASGGCGCSGCDAGSSPAKKPSTAQPIQIHRRNANSGRG